MKVLDLFAGLGGWSAPFIERGHEVVSVDIEERFGTTITADVLTLDDDMGDFDIICASPPCEKFSILALGHHWSPGYVPKHDGTLLAMELVRKTARIIQATNPAFWVVENPVGMLRKLHLLPYERQTVTYCRYGAPWRKPTDLWGGFPPSLTLKEMCRNGMSCHVSAPRGSRTSVQGDAIENAWWERAAAQPSTWGKSGHVNVGNAFGGGDRAAMRAVIPPKLALDVCIAAERDLAADRRATDYSGRLFV